MFYLYFSYAAVLALIVLYDSYQKDNPKVWAVIVFCAPVTTPWFIYKSREKPGILLYLVFFITFIAVGVTQFFLYSKYMEKHKYAHLDPVTRQMRLLSDELKATTVKLDEALVNLENMSKVESRVEEIKNTIEYIEELRTIMVENQEVIKRLVQYTSDHESFIDAKNITWVAHVQKFYSDRSVVQHHKSLEKYLVAFEELLKYTYVNFYNITQHQTREHLNNYDAYYMRYRRAVDTHNRFNIRRIDFQNSFLKKYSDVKPYLPGKRQTETFKMFE